MSNKFAVLLFVFLPIAIWGQDNAGFGFRPISPNLPTLSLKNQGIISINTVNSHSGNWHNGGLIQGAYSPMANLGIMGSMHFNDDDNKIHAFQESQQMKIFEVGAGIYYPRYTIADKTRFHLFEGYAGFSWGNASSYRMHEDEVSEFFLVKDIRI